jgi:protein PhnA
MSLPACPKCESEYVYQDQSLWICPECTYEWNPQEPDEDAVIVKDANGTLLSDGDKVTVAKDLKIKGSSQIIKIGTKRLLGAYLIRKTMNLIVKLMVLVK